MNDRGKDLAKIHLAKKQLGMCDDAYRDMLWVAARVRSASDLDEHGRRNVIEHLRKCGAKFKRGGRSRPSDERQSLVAKLRAQAVTAKVQDAYLDGMSKRMFGIDRFEWCEPDQLRRMVAAMAYHIKRHKGE